MARFFINRPIVAMVLSILMVIVGLVAMSGLPTAQFPNIVPPEIKVRPPDLDTFMWCRAQAVTF